MGRPVSTSFLPEKSFLARVLRTRGDFALRGGDVDVTVMPPLPREGHLNAEGVRHFQQGILIDWMRELEDQGWKVAKVGLGGRVPVLTVQLKGARRVADLTVRNGLAVHKSALLREYALLDPRLGDLVRFVKLWARRRGVYGQARGYLGGYACTLLCISFAQLVLSSVPSLQAGHCEYIVANCSTFQMTHSVVGVSVADCKIGWLSEHVNDGAFVLLSAQPT